MSAHETPAPPAGRLLRNVAFVRLWAAGGLTNTIRWLEILVSSLFVFEVSGSAFTVALVTMMRSLPMLLGGAMAGAIAEALDRRKLLLLGQFLNATSTAVVLLLGITGQLAVWHLTISSLASGIVWSTEMAVRRRMIGEAAGEHDIVRSSALDSITNNVTRMVGPIAGGLAFQTLGVTGGFAIATAGHLLSMAVSVGLVHRQEVRTLVLRGIPTAIVEATRFARTKAVLRTVLITSVLMNAFGFSYTAVLPAWGEASFQASPAMIGLLAAAEPLGALVGALIIASGKVPLRPSLMFSLGTTGFMILLVVAANMPLALAFAFLTLGGVGAAAFGSMQTTLVIINAPPESRSRVLGLVTTCVGMGPFGVLAAGALADRLGPVLALTIMGSVGAILMVLLRQRDDR